MAIEVIETKQKEAELERETERVRRVSVYEEAPGFRLGPRGAIIP